MLVLQREPSFSLHVGHNQIESFLNFNSIEKCKLVALLGNEKREIICKINGLINSIDEFHQAVVLMTKSNSSVKNWRTKLYFSFCVCSLFFYQRKTTVYVDISMLVCQIQLDYSRFHCSGCHNP